MNLDQYLPEGTTMLNLALLLVIAAVVLYFAFKQGWFGLTPERAAKEIARWNRQLAALQAKATAKAPVSYPSQPVKDKAAELDEVKALLAAERITPEDAAAKRKKILGID